MKSEALELPVDLIRDFCRRHDIRRLSLFGSALRADFRSDSDVDLLVEFEQGTRTGLRFFGMQEELARIVGRCVDLHTPASLSKSFRDEVIAEAEVLYDAS